MEQSEQHEMTMNCLMALDGRVRALEEKLHEAIELLRGHFGAEAIYPIRKDRDARLSNEDNSFLR